MRPKNNRMKELDRLIQNWEKYRALVVGALSESKVSPRHERNFLDLKAELAAQIQSLQTIIPRQMAYESKNTLEAMTEMLKRHVTLQNRDLGIHWEPDDFQNTWHQYFIYLNRLRGTDLVRGDDRSTRAASSTIGSDAARSGGWAGLGWVLAFSILAVMTFVLVSAAGVSLSSEGTLTFSAPKTLSHAVQNASGAFQSIVAGVLYVVDPVVASYGMTWTLLLAGAFLALMAVFMYGRS